jgi:hypothetical protein
MYSRSSNYTLKHAIATLKGITQAILCARPCSVELTEFEFDGAPRGQDPLPLANLETKLGTRRALTWELPGTLPAPVPLKTDYFDVWLPCSVI